MTKQTESTAFRDFAKRVISVPKAEIDHREAQWKKQRPEKKTRS